MATTETDVIKPVEWTVATGNTEKKTPPFNPFMASIEEALLEVQKHPLSDKDRAIAAQQATTMTQAAKLPDLDETIVLTYAELRSHMPMKGSTLNKDDIGVYSLGDQQLLALTLKLYGKDLELAEFQKVNAGIFNTEKLSRNANNPYELRQLKIERALADALGTPNGLNENITGAPKPDELMVSFSQRKAA